MTIPHDSTGIDALVRAIEALQERIRNDGDTIRSDEIRTRTALVDPLLTALGWDTTDPRMVIPEYRIGDMKVDYALVKVPKGRRRAKPVAFVEAKRMVEYLGDHRRQVFNYAYAGGVKYGCLTNGVRWVLYDVFNKDAPRNDRRVVDVSLRHEPAFDCAVKLLLLQATNLEHGMRLSITGAQALLDRAIETRASPAVIELLLDRGADIATKDSAGWTPLHHAVASNAHQSVVELLLKRGADTTAVDSRRWTPLHHAVASMARCVAPGCRRILHPMERVCKPDEGGCGMVQFTTCIQCWRETRLSDVRRGGLCAMCAGSEEADPLAVIAMLLDHGADIEARDAAGGSPLYHAAAHNSNPGVIALLLDRGADIEARSLPGWTPLQVAACHNLNQDAVALLIDHGADLTVQDSSNKTLTMLASSNPNSDVFALLVDRSPFIEVSSPRDWAPLLEAACRNSNPSVIRKLIECGADIEITDGVRQTPLHHAAALNTSTEVLSVLLDSGADIAATDMNGFTPLHIAAEWNTEPEVVRFLLDRGADIEARGMDDLTPLHWAAAHNPEPAVIKALLGRGANITARANFWSTPLHSAARRNTEPAVFKLLVERGGDVKAQDGTLQTPYQIAEARGVSEEILQLLRE